MFSLYGGHHGHARAAANSDKIGHERFYQRPVANSKKYKKRLYNHRKARSVAQIDSALLANARRTAAAAQQQQQQLASTSTTGSPQDGAVLSGCFAGVRRLRAPPLRHQLSTSLDDLTQLKIQQLRRRPSVCLNGNDEDEEDEEEEEEDDDDDEEEDEDKWMHLPLRRNNAAANSQLAVGRNGGGSTCGTPTTPPAGSDSSLSNSLESLAKFFSGVFTSSVGSRRSSNAANGNGTQYASKSTLPTIRRHYARYDYTALEDEPANQEKLEMEKSPPHQRGSARGSALITCQYYLKTSGRYTYLEQLNDIGSRIDKYWFMVHDATLKTDRMMTMVPFIDCSPLSVNGSTKATLSELFLALQHPYIYPILDVDFKTMSEETFVVIIFPFNVHGSLKDLIYRSNPRDDWHDKYGQRSIGLPESQIQRIGRQILEALTLLQDKGFPPFGHLHSGNVMIQNGVARLTGLENTMLGYTSRIYPMLRKRIRDCREAIDTICFGHILFEMAAAYELNVAHPTQKHLQDIQKHPQVLQVLNFIFHNEECRYPTIEELSAMDFFRNLDLREMRGTTSPPVFQATLSQNVKHLLKEVRKHQKYQKHAPSGRRSNSSSSLETPLREKAGNDTLEYKMGTHRNLQTATAAASCGVSPPNPASSSSAHAPSPQRLPGGGGAGSSCPNRGAPPPAAPSNSVVTVLENGDVRRHLWAATASCRPAAAAAASLSNHSSNNNNNNNHYFYYATDDSSAKSTPYCSLLDVSCHLAAPNGNCFSSSSTSINEEYHTPPTTPTVKTNELELRAVAAGARAANQATAAGSSATALQPNILQQCFQKIHETFEGAVFRAVSTASSSSSPPTSNNVRDSII